MMNNDIDRLQHDLQCSPVMGAFHPLVPLCLPPGVDVIPEAEALAEELDAPAPHAIRPVLITRLNPDYQGRFLVRDVVSCPAPGLVNQALPGRLDYARQKMLTQRQVASRIITDVVQKRYQAVALFLIDGLSYDDVTGWAGEILPCFVDGPSITFGKTVDGKIVPDVGFPGIVGSPPIVRRLMEAGIPHSCGYSYWGREQNDVSALLFAGIPLTRVESTQDAVLLLSDANLKLTYVQLVREGLDGLAHRRREVTLEEIRSTIEAIHNDYLRVVQVLAASGQRGAVYLTADHGILWKAQHKDAFVDLPGSGHPRYSRDRSTHPSHTSRFDMEGRSYYLYHYPYLGARIKANDSGTHGGLSYWESIVPFVRHEVNV